MNDHQWPQEIVDAANCIGVKAPLTCGQNKLGLKMGCDEPLDPYDHYRCTDCEVVFHKHCARKHFLESGDRAEVFRAQLQALHDLVDLTDPNCPIGTALTKVGCARRP